MILTGKEIEKRLNTDIIIEPFVKEQLNPNSYNLRLYNELLVYKNDILDPKINNETIALKIPEEGLILEPGQLYLARTLEYTVTKGLVPVIVGRSSIGRLGITVHITAGFGDVGFSGYWTMQLTCVKKVKIYPNMKICQIFYHTVVGEYDNYSSNKYQESDKILTSQLYKEIN